ncbi:hypothetical protein Fmac_022255 [Flemingia macrophylla]|uniref:Transducin/WD40 repeat-like superfamily protein n=1 Tax=Flemingia macrophylla TaxID=520843 RepID=A0ABD1LZ60_9FABA
MEKYLISPKPSIEKVRSHPRWHWKMSSVELNGRFEPKYRHEMMDLLTRSYSEVGAFPHLYHVDGSPCQSHTNRLVGEANGDNLHSFLKQGIFAVDFDSKGIYLASVTKSGCLTVHDFESLYCQIPELTSLKEDESKHLMHLSLNRQLDAVRWNTLNQDEVVCASVKSNELLIFNVGYISSDPVQVLRTKHTTSVHGPMAPKGLSDVAFTSNDTRILASDTYGDINVWDRRVNVLPCLELASASCFKLNRIQVNADNQTIFGAGKHGYLYVWDIRGGRASATFQSHNKEIRHQPVASVKLATLLEKIGSLKAQADIVPKEIHSIDINPSCPYQLAFHLEDGWSGVLDINSFQVTHIHCPPPAWLNDYSHLHDLPNLRKPAWLSTCSIYMVGSSSDRGIHLLNFYPDTNSPSHVDYKEDMQEIPRRKNRNNQNKFISLSEVVISCTAHPLYNAIVTGTKKNSLLVISQRQESCRIED